MGKQGQTPENIVVSHVYSSDNKGDAALTSVLLGDLKQAFPGAKITILTLQPGQHKTFEGVPEKPSFMHYALARRNPLAKLVYMSYMMSATLAWAALRKANGRQLYLPKHLRELAHIYEQADLIVPVGGGYLRSRAGLLNRANVPLLVHPLLLGWILGKPAILYSQSVGPFQNGFEEWLAALALKRMNLIMLREDISVKLLDRLGVSENVVRTTDAGFLLTGKGRPNLRKTYQIPPGKQLLGVTVRSWLAGNAQAAYELAVAKALDNIVQDFGVQVIFIPQVTAAKGDDDRLASHRVRQQMRRKKSAVVIGDEPDHHHIKAIYGELDLLLGTRFHSVIFALTSYVPVLAIEYEYKTSGIMRDLGLEEWVIKIEDATEQRLTKTLQHLMWQTEKYKDQLLERLPAYLLQAEQTSTLLEEHYRKTTM